MKKIEIDVKDYETMFHNLQSGFKMFGWGNQSKKKRPEPIRLISGAGEGN